MDGQEKRKVIITVAATGAQGDKAKHPGLPIAPKEIAQSALEAQAAGASVVHVPVRNLQTGKQSMEVELYREVLDRIRESSDMIVNLTMGPGGQVYPDRSDPVAFGPGTVWHSPERRSDHIVKLRPDMCSIDVGTINMKERIFANAYPHVEEMARRILEVGVKPELEVFDLGHIEIAKSLIEKGLVKSPPIFQLCLGVPWGIPATPKNMLVMKEALPPNAVWSALGTGPASFPMAAQAVLLGGNVRVGFEDNFYLSRGVHAGSNAELVEKAARIIEILGGEVASAADARKIFGLNTP